MKSLVIALVLALASPSGEASEAKASQPLQLRPKAALLDAKVHRFAPFSSPSDEPDLELVPRRDEREEASRSSCSGDRTLCYDPRSGRIVYKPARALMPDLPGLQRENISVKRDRIVFRYSF
ncbi:MAG TPA: hypothetical protein VEC19_20440 [Usitatibacter sp.]|nr:hypothetical protein [Usitatibacter sp.]